MIFGLSSTTRFSIPFSVSTCVSFEALSFAAMRLFWHSLLPKVLMSLIATLGFLETMSAMLSSCLTWQMFWLVSLHRVSDQNFLNSRKSNGRSISLRTLPSYYLENSILIYRILFRFVRQGEQYRPDCTLKVYVFYRLSIYLYYIKIF